MNDSFGIIAEFSIGLAGFSGIVTLIGNTSSQDSSVSCFQFVENSVHSRILRAVGTFIVGLLLNEREKAA